MDSHVKSALYDWLYCKEFTIDWKCKTKLPEVINYNLFHISYFKFINIIFSEPLSSMDALIILLFKITLSLISNDYFCAITKNEIKLYALHFSQSFEAFLRWITFQRNYVRTPLYSYIYSNFEEQIYTCSISKDLYWS